MGAGGDVYYKLGPDNAPQPAESWSVACEAVIALKLQKKLGGTSSSAVLDAINVPGANFCVHFSAIDLSGGATPSPLCFFVTKAPSKAVLSRHHTYHAAWIRAHALASAEAGKPTSEPTFALAVEAQQAAEALKKVADAGDKSVGAIDSISLLLNSSFVDGLTSWTKTGTVIDEAVEYSSIKDFMEMAVKANVKNAMERSASGSRENPDPPDPLDERADSPRRFVL